MNIQDASHSPRKPHLGEGQGLDAGCLDSIFPTSASCLTSLNFCIFICKMRVMIRHSSWDGREMRGRAPSKHQSILLVVLHNCQLFLKSVFSVTPENEEVIIKINKIKNLIKIKLSHSKELLHMPSGRTED